MAQAHVTDPGTLNGVHTGVSEAKKAFVPSTTKEALIGWLTCAKVLLDDKTISRTFDKLEEIPHLEGRISRLIESDKTRQSEISKKVADHEDIRQQMLEDFGKQYGKRAAEQARLQDENVTLRQLVIQRETELDSSRSDLTNQAAQTRTLQAAMEKRVQDVVNVEKKADGLARALHTQKKEKDVLTATLDQKNHHIKQLGEELSNLQKQHSALSIRAQRHTKELQAAASLTVPLEDDMQITQKLEAFWLKASHVVCSTFIPDRTFDDQQGDTFWPRFGREDFWVQSLPRPQSVSHAAKQMRCAMILRDLANKITDHIFQPIFPLPAHNNLRETLLLEAQSKSEREAAFRALLQALLPDDQAAASISRTRETCDALMTPVVGLLPPDGEARFRNLLKALVEEACQLWRGMLRLPYAVDLNFGLPHQSDSGWKQLLITEQPSLNQHPQSSDVDRDEAVFVIFPHLVMVDEDGEAAMNDAVVLTKSQVQPAREEISGLSSSPRQGKSSSGWSKVPKHRRPSEVARSTQGTSEVANFLAQGS